MVNQTAEEGCLSRVTIGNRGIRVCRSPKPLLHCPPNSHGINLFADLCPLTRVASIFYKNMEGRGCYG